MKEVLLSRERMVWAAIVAALATSAAWLAAIGVALLASRAGFEGQEIWAAGRALVRIAWHLIREAAPASMLALLAAGTIVVVAWARGGGEPGERRERHG